MKLPILITCTLLITMTNASNSNNRGVRRQQENQRRVSKAGKGSKAESNEASGIAGIDFMVEDETTSLNSLGFVVDGTSISISMSMYEPTTIDSRRRLSKGSKSSETLTTTRPTTAGKASKASSRATTLQSSTVVPTNDVPTTDTTGGSDTGIAGGYPIPISTSAIDIDLANLLSIEQDENSLSMSMPMIEER